MGGTGRLTPVRLVNLATKVNGGEVADDQGITRSQTSTIGEPLPGVLLSTVYSAIPPFGDANHANSKRLFGMSCAMDPLLSKKTRIMSGGTPAIVTAAALPTPIECRRTLCR
jgi:hypothetical protein